MMGNVWEWCETAYDGTNRVIRGGAYDLDESYLVSTYQSLLVSSNQVSNVGFRVAAVPEPATALLLSVGGIGVWMLRRNSRKSKEEQQG
jgi:predicted small integral membrane protein